MYIGKGIILEEDTLGKSLILEDGNFIKDMNEIDKYDTLDGLVDYIKDMTNFTVNKECYNKVVEIIKAKYPREKWQSIIVVPMNENN